MYNLLLGKKENLTKIVSFGVIKCLHVSVLYRTLINSLPYTWKLS